MLELEDAQERIVSSVRPCTAEVVAIDRALGRVLAGPVVAPIPLPPFDNSAMDGYALRAADVQSATAGKPAVLRIAGALPAGAEQNVSIQPGSCCRIFTGARLPQGADAVVMQEETHRAGDSIEIHDPVRLWENVRLAGEDLKEGEVAVHPGEKITSGRIALLGAMGIKDLFVTRQPLVGIVSTGDELIESGPLRPGHIFESNRNTIGSLLRQAGAGVCFYPLVGDTLSQTRALLQRALAECDFVITTGGVSVGEHDVVKPAFEALGGSLEFWQVSIKPGKPFVFGCREGKFLFGLPGNPVSAFVTCLLLVFPAVLQFQGARNTSLPEHPAILAEDVVNRGARRHFMRVSIDSRGMIRSAGMQASHALRSLANANALLPVPPNTTWTSGRTVSVLRWEF